MYELIWNTDTIFIPCGDNVRDRSTAYYLLNVGLRLDGVK